MPAAKDSTTTMISGVDQVPNSQLTSTWSKLSTANSVTSAPSVLAATSRARCRLAGGFAGADRSGVVVTAGCCGTRG
jgi:hypothetical protein